MGNSNLTAAKKAANDEFYTQLSDIENEVKHYKDFFKGKTVYLNCDDPEESNFWKFFELKFEEYGLKKLISTHFDSKDPTYKLELQADVNDDGKINKLDIIKTPLELNGDFRSPEGIELLKEADVIVTNPPFSLFREYIAQLMEYNKKFLVIGSKNAVTYKEIFPLIKNNKLWLGYNSVKEFRVPKVTNSNCVTDENGNITAKFGNICWFTNIPTKKRSEKLVLTKEYDPKDYPKYDNYDAIEVSKVVDIPEDYTGVMGVPITFLDKYCPDQFEIIGLMSGAKDKTLINGNDGKAKFYVGGKGVYARILIKKK